MNRKIISKCLIKCNRRKFHVELFDCEIRLGSSIRVGSCADAQIPCRKSVLYVGLRSSFSCLI